MPEPFGTHHTKMMILLRHDDAAQVVVHTANMIAQDWSNMTQAMWRSPLLPLMPMAHGSSKSGGDGRGRGHGHGTSGREAGTPLPKIGSGQRFKHDLLRYLQVYGSRTASVVSELRGYDFAAVKGAFVASVPGRIPDASGARTAVVGGSSSATAATAATAATTAAVNGTPFGWQGLKQVLESVECEDDYSSEDDDGDDEETEDEDTSSRMERSGRSKSSKTNASPQINIQVSSIASLGPKDTWLKAFIDVLSTSASSTLSSTSSTSSQAAAAAAESKSKAKAKAKTKADNLQARPNSTASPITRIIWPTVADVGNSLNGYASGGSIHMRLKSATASKQMEYLRSYLCRWSTARKPMLAMLREGYENANGNGNSTGSGSRDGPLVRNVDPSTMLEVDDGNGTLDGDGGVSGRDKGARLPATQSPARGRALRNLAAPHIKTYIRFSRRGNVDWALVTSANLSTQAWGAGRGRVDGSVRVCSYEAGVLVWPGLWEGEGVECDENGSDGGGDDDRKDERIEGGGRVGRRGTTTRKRRRARMVPVFGQDAPSPPTAATSISSAPSAGKGSSPVTVAFRMPYDMPLLPYTAGDEPWAADQLHAQPDWRGVVWDPALLGM